MHICQSIAINSGGKALSFWSGTGQACTAQYKVVAATLAIVELSKHGNQGMSNV